MFKHLIFLCLYAVKEKTVTHIILNYELLINKRKLFRRNLPPLMLKTKADLAAATDRPKSAKKIAHWLLAIKKLTIYNLAEQINGTKKRLRRLPKEKRRGKTGPSRGTLLKVALKKLALLKDYFRNGVE